MNGSGGNIGDLRSVMLNRSCLLSNNILPTVAQLVRLAEKHRGCLPNRLMGESWCNDSSLHSVGGTFHGEDTPADKSTEEGTRLPGLFKARRVQDVGHDAKIKRHKTQVVLYAQTSSKRGIQREKNVTYPAEAVEPECLSEARTPVLVGIRAKCGTNEELVNALNAKR